MSRVLIERDGQLAVGLVAAIRLMFCQNRLWFTCPGEVKGQVLLEQPDRAEPVALPRLGELLQRDVHALT
jgi:hypothetical protein